jgi:hypothetical protein
MAIGWANAPERDRHCLAGDREQGVERACYGEFCRPRQGKGTLAARHGEARILFRFFKLTPDNGISEFLDSRILSVTVESADTERPRPSVYVPGAKLFASNGCDRWPVACAFLRVSHCGVPCFPLSRNATAEQPIRTLSLRVWRDGRPGAGEAEGDNRNEA